MVSAGFVPPFRYGHGRHDTCLLSRILTPHPSLVLHSSFSRVYLSRTKILKHVLHYSDHFEAYVESKKLQEALFEIFQKLVRIYIKKWLNYKVCSTDTCVHLRVFNDKLRTKLQLLLENTNHHYLLQSRSIKPRGRKCEGPYFQLAPSTHIFKTLLWFYNIGLST